MKENFKIILQAFEDAGIRVKTAEFSITEYSLNTDLSFKFEDLEEFLEFLHLEDSDNPRDEEKIESINTAFIEKGIDPERFFYVNFYSPKIAEL